MNRITTLLAALIAMPTLVLADATNGDFLGYSLGATYGSNAATVEKVRTNGTLVIEAQSPVKPDDIASVSLIVTSETKTIGHISGSQWFATEAEAREFARHYVNLLHAKYSDWEFGREKMDNNLRINEINLDKQPNNIRFRLDEELHDGQSMWRFSMTLNWLPTSKESQAWQNMARSQHNEIIVDERKQLLKNADLRGL
jgi:hypothetical protein